MHPALKKLHFRSTIAEVDSAIVEATGNNWRYAKDNDFEQYVLKDIITVEQLKAVIDLLNADRYAMEGSKKYTCQKTWGFSVKNLKRDMKKYPHWLTSSGNWLADKRRICCCCHESGSFGFI